MTKMNDRFLKACRCEKTDCTPVWFMRQAGRYMKSYRTIREKYGLMEMFKNPDLATEITLQPVRAFALDAAIIFADILLPLEGMGIEFGFEEKHGPVMKNPVCTVADIDALRITEPEQDLDFVLESLRRVRAELEGKLPLIGFAGAPFTLAGYMIEGGSSLNHMRTKQLMYHEPDAWNLLMKKLCNTLITYLKAQVKAGAQVVQLFDSWVGCLSPSDYRHYVLPHSQRILTALHKENIPTIHFGTATAGLLPLMAEAGGDVIGADWRISLTAAWRAIEKTGKARGLQGNLDPIALMAPSDLLKKQAAEVLNEAAARPGHIFNLGHGLLPSTPEDAVKTLVDFVHEYQTDENYLQ